MPRTVAKPLGFKQHSPLLEFSEADGQFLLDAADCLKHGRSRCHIVRIRVDAHRFDLSAPFPCQRIDLHDLLDLVAEEADSPGPVLEMGWPDIEGVAAQAEASPVKEIVVSTVLERDEFARDLARLEALVMADIEPHGGVRFHRSDAVDAGDGSHDQNVVPLHQCAGSRVAHAVDLLVDLGFLLDVGVRARNIGFRLVVVVIGYEVLDRVVGKERLELAVELRGEGLVVCQHDCGPLRGLYDLGHGVGLAGSRRTEKNLIPVSTLDSLDQFGNGLGLVALGLQVARKLERLSAFEFSILHWRTNFRLGQIGCQMALLTLNRLAANVGRTDRCRYRRFDPGVPGPAVTSFITVV